MGPGDLAQVLGPLQAFWSDVHDPALLVGMVGAPDDGAVYRVSDEVALIQSVDFFTPIVDDARDYGAIAAANALSDIYAMGGEPLFALNIGAFPDNLPRSIISEIFLGAAEVVRDAGAVVAGGHTVVDREPKFGLVVTGRVHPDHLTPMTGAQPGDLLLLTKPLGSGIIATAARNDALRDANHLAEAVASMRRLNRGAARAMQGIATAVTDVTGFGLLGHASEMAAASDVAFTLVAPRLPLLSGVIDYAHAGQIAGGLHRNRDHFRAVRVDANVSAPLADVAWDPQTSGGLLIALPSAQLGAFPQRLVDRGESAELIGHVSRGSGVRLVNAVS